MDNTKRDTIISRVFIIAVLAIVLPWLWNGVVWVWHWYTAYSASDASGWSDTWHFIIKNFSIILIAYTIISLQAAGIAEFKFKRRFLTAFLLALLVTPPIMMATYGRHGGDQ